MVAPASISAGSAVKSEMARADQTTRPRDSGVERGWVDVVEQVFGTCAAPAAEGGLRGADEAGVLQAPGGVSAEAWASTLARERNPPRRAG